MACRIGLGGGFEMTMRWRCLICGYVHVGKTPPYVCPICNAPQKMFERMEEDDPSDREKGKI